MRSNLRFAGLKTIIILGFLGLRNPKGGTWIVFQQVVTRFMGTLKFFIAAKILGPGEIGLIGLVLLFLVVIESLTTTGIQQALTHALNERSDRDLGAIWTFQLCRGILICLILLLSSNPLCKYFNIESYAYLIYIGSIIPILRSFINPGIYLLQRKRYFKKLAFYEISSSFGDLVISVLLAFMGYGAVSLVVGIVLSELIKNILSWKFYQAKLIINFKWNLFSDLRTYGKWIWLSNIFILLLNQSDKFIIAKLLGPVDLGVYQVASKISQLIIGEPSGIVGQYIYPKLCEYNRNSKIKTEKYFNNIRNLMLKLILVIIFLAIIFSGIFFNILFSKKWLNLTEIFRVMLIPAGIGALIILYVQYLQAIGKPKYITFATVFQLISLIAFMPILFEKFKIYGILIAMAMSGLVALLFMIYGKAKFAN